MLCLIIRLNAEYPVHHASCLLVGYNCFLCFFSDVCVLKTKYENLIRLTDICAFLYFIILVWAFSSCLCVHIVIACLCVNMAIACLYVNIAVDMQITILTQLVCHRQVVNVSYRNYLVHRIQNIYIAVRSLI